ncbi:hypothetical protein ACHAWF_017145 [Thalassiosira exigua]
MDPVERSASFDSDACVPPFLLSQIGHQGDISTITPLETLSNFPTQGGGSLFSRLSRGLSSPTLYSTPIDAESTPPVETHPRDDSINETSHRSTIVGDPRLSFGAFIADQDCRGEDKVKNICRQWARNPEVADGAGISWEISPPLGSVCTERANGAGKSWEMSPSLGTSTKSDSVCTGFQRFEALNIRGEEIEATKSPRLPTGSASAGDEWKEATDRESGRPYYYNRRTRESKWRLPKGATLVCGRSKSRSHCTNESELLPRQPSINGNNTGHGNKVCFDRRSPESLQKSETEFDRHSCESPQHSQTAFEENSPDSPQRSEEALDENSQSSLQLQENNPNFDQRSAANENEGTARGQPQDADCTTPGAVFCLYCGTRCGADGVLGSVQILSSHLPNCAKFMQMEMSTQTQLESALFNAWSRISTSQAANQVNKASNGTTSSGADSAHNYARAVNNCGIIENKKCPFCQLAFQKGNEFSSHLLKCKIRKRARKQRRVKKKEDDDLVDPRRKCVTPGRRLPWE